MLEAEEMIEKQLKQIREQLMNQALESHGATVPHHVLTEEIDREMSKLGPQLLMAMVEKNEASPPKPVKKIVKKAAKQKDVPTTTPPVATGTDLAENATHRRNCFFRCHFDRPIL